ncbi:hypothetical protein BSL82_11925 [Tardibacter chloracetimidivorans]|uniref:Short-chain dehydrogenase n=1 Tax=Tardibacter chloracetimidivorans TaxID=1921510 RepID=A0A1L3ZWE3_9SPHN|nr:SDR family oxidoreductase [Tardibacter chloracetimidivorans]API59930.1 hypothetical protein BSL82_11925 [Tardibacter chloracetimidivorans]
MESAARHFQDKNALGFGGGKGIGKAVVVEWARRGARVAIADIDLAAARETSAEIVSLGGCAIALEADVTSEASISAAIAETEAVFGDIDILMNNVGAALNGNPEDIPLSEWMRITDLNYLGTVRAVTALLPKMLARGTGHIVNTASFAGLYPYAASRMPYAASKAAVIALSESLALYLEPQGIRVSCLIPGPVVTDFMASMTSWTKDCPIRGPGSEFKVMMPAEVGVVLADAMAAGQILVPSDDAVWKTLEQWAKSPDRFIKGKIDDFARGEAGMPVIANA